MSVFLSYSHKDETIANLIDNMLQEKNIQVKRDVRDANIYCRIKDFMAEIRDSDYVVMIISENYLHSSMCLFEIVELFKTKNYSEKIVPIVLNDVRIYSALDRLEYYDYWKNEYTILEKKIKSYDVLPDISTVIENDLTLIKNILSNIMEFLDIISNIKHIIIAGGKIDDNIVYNVLEKIGLNTIVDCNYVFFNKIPDIFVNGLTKINIGVGRNYSQGYK
jgi:hypothetical protein